MTNRYIHNLSFAQGWIELGDATEALRELNRIPSRAHNLEVLQLRYLAFALGEQWIEEIDGLRLAAMHGDDTRRLNALITSGVHNIVFRGHSHERLDTQIGSTRVINPGAIGGKKKEAI